MNASRPQMFHVTQEHYDDDRQKLLCPLCSYDYTHLLDITEIRTSDTYSGHPSVRGNVIVMPGWCENGCRFNLFIGQHKGYTFIWGEERTVLHPGDVSFDEPDPDMDLD